MFNAHSLHIFLFLKGSCFAFLFTVTVNALEGKDCKESVKLIAESSNLSEEQLAFLISGMYTLLREALRLPLSTFKQEVSFGSTWSPGKCITHQLPPEPDLQGVGHTHKNVASS